MHMNYDANFHHRCYWSRARAAKEMQKRTSEDQAWGTNSASACATGFIENTKAPGSVVVEQSFSRKTRNSNYQGLGLGLGRGVEKGTQKAITPTFSWVQMTSIPYANSGGREGRHNEQRPPSSYRRKPPLRL